MERYLKFNCIFDVNFYMRILHSQRPTVLSKTVPSGQIIAFATHKTMINQHWYSELCLIENTIVADVKQLWTWFGEVIAIYTVNARKFLWSFFVGDQRIWRQWYSRVWSVWWCFRLVCSKIRQNWRWWRRGSEQRGIFSAVEVKSAVVQITSRT